MGSDFSSTEADDTTSRFQFWSSPQIISHRSRTLMDRRRVVSPDRLTLQQAVSVTTITRARLNVKTVKVTTARADLEKSYETFFFFLHDFSVIYMKESV